MSQWQIECYDTDGTFLAGAPKLDLAAACASVFLVRIRRPRAVAILTRVTDEAKAKLRMPSIHTMCEIIADSWNALAPIVGKPYDGEKAFDALTCTGSDFSCILPPFAAALDGGAVWPKRLRAS
jgi:hypothetical protein